jgi:hypothetical protein
MMNVLTVERKNDHEVQNLGRKKKDNTSYGSSVKECQNLLWSNNLLFTVLQSLKV